MARRNFKHTFRLAKSSRKNSDETDVLLSPVKTASPRKERSFDAHRRRFVVKVETDTQGSILDHLDVHSNVRQTFRDIIFRLHAGGTFTLSIKRDLLPTWHRVSLKNGNSGANMENAQGSSISEINFLNYFLKLFHLTFFYIIK